MSIKLSTMLQFYINLSETGAISNKNSYLYNFISSSITCQGAYLNLKIIIASSLTIFLCILEVFFCFFLYFILNRFFLQHPIYQASAKPAGVEKAGDLFPSTAGSASI